MLSSFPPFALASKHIRPSIILNHQLFSEHIYDNPCVKLAQIKAIIWYELDDQIYRYYSFRY